MKIEIAEPGRMTQSGSSLLKLIQNNKTPILDLFVRESIQNSLDAHKDNASFVTVEYTTGSFSSSKLSKELEGITIPLSKRFPNDMCHYIAVSDSNTVGLTGEIDVSKVKDNNYGNLLKLVYEICKPQTNEGAGGSWGLGKTVYFRMGIGLVIYYSRIDEGNGKYSSRLVASLVENESNPDAMIPEYKGMAKRGIAWWGDYVRENTTVPMTDENYISQFLSIFGMEPYSGEKTGTTIIVPYTNNEMLLANNRIDYSDEIEDHLYPYWYSSIDNYIRIAVQRWYAPRLVNQYYPYGAYLRVSINRVGIGADKMEPVFKIVQELYNYANHINEKGYLSSNEIEVTVGETKVNKVLSSANAGTIACAKLNREILKMNVPDNKPEPAVYFNCEIADRTVNRPTVFFVRQPGMIVSYENVSVWTAGIPCTDKDNYIFGIFVLNSLNPFKSTLSPVEKLEEYVRKSEMADHTSWNDWTDSQFNPRIISKIQKSVAKVISSKYSEESVEHKTKKNSELSRYIGDLILPPDGYGTGANQVQDKKIYDSKKPRKSFSFNVIPAEISFNVDTMTIPIELKTSSNKKISQVAFEMKIDSESSKISIEEWENTLKLVAPFSISEIGINVDFLDGERTKDCLIVDNSNKSISYKGLNFELRHTSTGTITGLDIRATEEHSLKIKFSVLVHLMQKNVRPTFEFEKGD